MYILNGKLDAAWRRQSVTGVDVRHRKSHVFRCDLCPAPQESTKWPSRHQRTSNRRALTPSILCGANTHDGNTRVKLAVTTRVSESYDRRVYVYVYDGEHAVIINADTAAWSTALVVHSALSLPLRARRFNGTPANPGVTTRYLRRCPSRLLRPADRLANHSDEDDFQTCSSETWPDHGYYAFVAAVRWQDND